MPSPTPSSAPASVSAMATSEAQNEAIERLRERFEEIGWYHTQELAPGLVTPGMFDLRPLIKHYGVPDDLTGKRVLDVGTFEGFWAFELERRGADVTAIDVDRIQDLDWPPRLRPAEDGRRGEGFELARAALGSSVNRVGMSIYDATPDALGGQFDLVFCGSVLIHLRDPMLALERMAALCRGQLILAEEYSRRLAWTRLKLAEFRGDTPWSTWWRPAPRTWLSMVEVAGFRDVSERGRFSMRFSGRGGGVPHVVVHARGAAI
jgi:tRNA (mo5U34)-methyltransferase